MQVVFATEQVVKSVTGNLSLEPSVVRIFCVVLLIFMQMVFVGLLEGLGFANINCE